MKGRKSKREPVQFTKAESSGSDHWEGGVLFDSGSDPGDEDLSQFLQSTASFVHNMTQTAAFTVA